MHKVGVYDHVPGDGREFVIVSPSAAAIRAEDGRSITGTDISNFIQNLPYGKVRVARQMGSPLVLLVACRKKPAILSRPAECRRQMSTSLVLFRRIVRVRAPARKKQQKPRKYARVSLTRVAFIE